MFQSLFYEFRNGKEIKVCVFFLGFSGEVL